jgi:uncharacterized protein YndB with AHSA1/START domain
VAAKSSLDLNSDPRVMIGTREFDAPRDLVYAVFTDPKHLAQWWGPNGFTTTTLSFDMRPGGVWRFVMHGPDGRDYQNRITYEEVVPPQRLVYRHGGGEVRRSRRPHAHHLARRLPVRGGTRSRHQGIRRQHGPRPNSGAAGTICVGHGSRFGGSAAVTAGQLIKTHTR